MPPELGSATEPLLFNGLDLREGYIASSSISAKADSEARLGSMALLTQR
jgi:hypothetical protein